MPILENLGISGTSVTMNAKIAEAFYNNDWVYPRLPQMKINVGGNTAGTTYYIDDFKIEEVERYPFAENDAVSYRVADGKIAAGGTVKVDYNFISNSDNAQKPFARILHSSDGESWAGYGIEEVDFEEFKQIYEQNMNENIQGIITADFAVDDFDEEEDDFEENVEIEQTTEILHSLGFYWPEPDKEYLKRVIDYLNKFYYFE